MSLRENLEAGVLEAFIDTGTFGASATYTPTGGSPATITVSPGNITEREEDGEDGRTLIIETTILLALADVAAPAAGDKVTLDSVDYNVGDIEARGDSFAVVHLHRFEQVEASREGHRRRRV